MCLALRPEVRFRPESFGGLAFIPSRQLVIELNRTGYQILEHIASRNVMEEDIYRQFPEEKRPTVRQFIKDMSHSSIIRSVEHEDQLSPLPIFATPDSVNATNIEQGSVHNKNLTKYLSAPIFVWWDITRACNLRCKQCYSAAGKVAPDELSTAEVLSVLEQLAANMVFYIYFLGGEPLLRNDFFEILSECRVHRITTMMSTNGWFVDREIAHRLLESGIQIVRVSIDGATPNTHDKVRGVRGSFERALRAVRILKDVGIPNVGVSPTLLTDNYHQIDRIIRLALEYGADEVQVVQLCSTGRAKNLVGLNPDQFKTARQLVRRALFRHPSKHITATEGILRKQCEICVSQRIAVPSFLGCPGGRTCMAVDEAGRVFPCILYREPAGSFRQSSLTDIWYNSPVFIAMRKIKEGCQQCVYADRCARECPLVMDRVSDVYREQFSTEVKGCAIGVMGCEQFVGEESCFIRF